MKPPQPDRERLHSAKQVRQGLLEDPVNYVESVGKIDYINLAPDPKAQKRGKTVLRLVFGATESMPFRGLSYIDSAVRSAKHLDIDQIQVIHANAVGNRINGVNKFKSDDEAARLADAAAEITARAESENLSILHAIDTRLDTEKYEPLARLALENNPKVAEKLMKKGAKHGGDALAYTAVHFAFQDTDNLELQPVDPSAPAQERAETIISIGCQQERTFYMARMAMRDVAAEADGMIDKTAQIFTKHVSPPYYVARGGEPLLAEGIDPKGRYDFFGENAIDGLPAVGDEAARRDIRHFITVNNTKEHTNE